jgi:hypothetical protein
VQSFFDALSLTQLNGKWNESRHYWLERSRGGCPESFGEDKVLQKGECSLVLTQGDKLIRPLDNIFLEDVNVCCVLLASDDTWLSVVDLKLEKKKMENVLDLLCTVRGLKLRSSYRSSYDMSQ